jgi:hypothetical protein
MESSLDIDNPVRGKEVRCEYLNKTSEQCSEGFILRRFN